METLLTALGTGVNYANGNGLPPLYHLKWGDHLEQQVIFEMSADMRRRIDQRCGFDPALVRTLHIAVSHAHESHFGGVYAFKNAREHAYKSVVPGQVNIYGPAQLADAFKLLMYAHRPERSVDHIPDPFNWLLADDGIAVGDATLQSFPVFHQDPLIESVGFRVALPDGLLFVYTGDIQWPTDPDLREHYDELLLKFTSGVDVLLCDARTPNGKRNAYHFSAYEAGMVAYRANVRQLVLTNYTGIDQPTDMINAAYESGFKGSIEVLNVKKPLILRPRHTL